MNAAVAAINTVSAKGSTLTPSCFAIADAKGYMIAAAALLLIVSVTMSVIKYTTYNAPRGEGSINLITSLAIVLARPLDCMDVANEMEHPININSLKSTNLGTSAAFNHPPTKKIATAAKAAGPIRIFSAATAQIMMTNTATGTMPYTDITGGTEPTVDATKKSLLPFSSSMSDVLAKHNTISPAASTTERVSLTKNPSPDPATEAASGSPREDPSPPSPSLFSMSRSNSATVSSGAVCSWLRERVEIIPTL